MTIEFKELTDENLEMYAMQHYDNPHFINMGEFYDDLKLVAYIKRLLNRYHRDQELNSRLLLNHLIIFHNMFGSAGTRILKFKIDGCLTEYLNSCLIYLSRATEEEPHNEELLTKLREK